MATRARRVDAARDLRQRQTPAEALLWARLRRNQLGVPFRRQHGIGPFVVDFCCLPHRLIIELDGSIHDRVDVQAQDVWRMEWLEQRGYRVTRFRNEDVLLRMDVVVGNIRSLLAENGG